MVQSLLLATRRTQSNVCFGIKFALSETKPFYRMAWELSTISHAWRGAQTIKRLAIGYHASVVNELSYHHHPPVCWLHTIYTVNYNTCQATMIPGSKAHESVNPKKKRGIINSWYAFILVFGLDWDYIKWETKATTRLEDSSTQHKRLCKPLQKFCQIVPSWKSGQVRI